MSELDFEKQIVKQLSIDSNQWTERKDLYGATPDDLWNNLREKLNQNNWAALKQQPLTDEEFSRVKRVISNVQTPYEAAKLLDSENGIGKIDIQRDDATLGNVMLKIFWKADVAGGNSSYEIVRQAIRPHSLTNDSEQDRRFDVTLLINGLPLIQLELKKSGVSIYQAFNQIKKYAKENKYDDIYSLLQMFVILSPESSAYFANCQADDFNRSFVFNWRDQDNHPVQNGMDFAKQVLNIPMAHKVVSEYTAIDEERKKLLLLRPYQIYAIEAVLKRIKQRENGYVWHTTGSGKTLTSYKTAKLAAQQPSVDRVVFLVDRKALDDQTTSNFNAYAENDDMEIKDAKNTNNLRQELLKNDGKILISSIQKMSRLVNKELANAEAGKNTRISKVLKMRVCFFVDEAHRSQFGQMRNDIKKAFVNSNWYGYTGTPIFSQNHKKIKGDMGVTTEELFGKVCHTYNLRNALEDNAVLPFNIEHVNTIKNIDEVIQAIKEKQLSEKLAAQGRTLEPNDKLKLSAKIQAMPTIEKEKLLPNSIYEQDAHLDAVVDYILDCGPRKTSQGNGNYNAILTTSSIDMAIRYYNKINARKQQKVNDYDKDWPRVAITYSLSENDDDSIKNRTPMESILKDYNQTYGTNFHNNNEEIGWYNDDVAKRTARRESYFAHLSRSKEINLVIVVRRLLTGFDAPRLNTLFVDRIFENADLIQAYSRTNRLENNDYKREGQIVTFRKPATTEKNEEAAYALYGGEGSYEELVRPKYRDAMDSFKTIVNQLRAVAPDADSADDLKGIKAKINFVKIFQKLTNQLNSLAMYNDFSWNDVEQNMNLSEQELKHYVGKFMRIREEATNPHAQKTHDEIDNLDFSLSVGSTILVDYDYITGLIKDLIKSRPHYQSAEEQQLNMSEYIQQEAAVQEKINEYDKSGHPKQAALLREILKSLEDDDTNQMAMQDIDAYIAGYRQNKLNALFTNFAQQWGLDVEMLKRLANDCNVENDDFPHLQDLVNSGDASHAANVQNDEQLNMPFLYNVKAETAIKQFIKTEINDYKGA
ncbi:type I restriction endonuclease subunit R [Apilactobacillus xinyiensis]|uniref:type I restriction endonuclease subunit R n=1 Tax=Apilactobacillus xinyiensis TaxID=2841032 RepID=UPI002010BC70|nr:HsdR family type I site-specific deoxyribonuclease [Apilactobacillus xinyiensis]MCL0330080.1 HsdR family type I site-specific deoxyribonuclease [Apilactobacillus xinyiensis]